MLHECDELKRLCERFNETYSSKEYKDNGPYIDIEDNGIATLNLPKFDISMDRFVYNSIQINCCPFCSKVFKRVENPELSC